MRKTLQFQIRSVMRHGSIRSTPPIAKPLHPPYYPGFLGVRAFRRPGAAKRSRSTAGSPSPKRFFRPFLIDQKGAARPGRAAPAQRILPTSTTENPCPTKADAFAGTLFLLCFGQNQSALRQGFAFGKTLHGAAAPPRPAGPRRGFS